MTTDPFTTAARAEADRQYWNNPNAATTLPGHRVPFTAGAVWARDHLAAQEGHRRVRKYADDWDTCTCGYDAWPCRSQEPTDAECLAVLNVAMVPLGEPPKRNGLADWNPAAVERVRAALSAARAVRRDEESR